jgi:colanic acid biosynthesis glycosyl transferase WcaI
MKILLLTQFFQPEPMFKGLPLARALQARGHDVSVLTGHPNYPGGRLYPSYGKQRFWREEMEGVRISRVPLFPSHDSSGLRRALNYLSFGAASAWQSIFREERPDVVWVYNLVTLAVTWNILRKLHGCAVVLEVQDLWPESVIGSGMMRRSRTLDLALTAACEVAYRSADGLVAQSPGFRSRLIDRGVSADRIRVIPNWTEESGAEPTPEDRLAARRRAWCCSLERWGPHRRSTV